MCIFFSEKFHLLKLSVFATFLQFVIIKNLGGPIMANYSRNDITKMVKEQDVKFIRLQFTDIFGTLKNIAITAGVPKEFVDRVAQQMVDEEDVSVSRAREIYQTIYPAVGFCGCFCCTLFSCYYCLGYAF